MRHLTTRNYAALLQRAAADPRLRAHDVLSQPSYSVQRLVCAVSTDGPDGFKPYSAPHRFGVDQTIAVLHGAAWLVTWSGGATAAAPGAWAVQWLQRGDVVDLSTDGGAPFHSVVPAAPFHSVVPAGSGHGVRGVVFLETLGGPYGDAQCREELPDWPAEVGRGGNAESARLGHTRLAAIIGRHCP